MVMLLVPAVPVSAAVLNCKANTLSFAEIAPPAEFTLLAGGRA